LKLDEEEIEVINEIKYLGVTLDSRAKWKKQNKQIASGEGKQ
jgi:hypothetical protein